MRQCLSILPSASCLRCLTVSVVGLRRAGLLVGGATLFLTMPLATAYTTGITFGIGFLDIPAMAATHGALNVVGFAIPTMAGWARATR